jgi:polyribonucleotide nucleotidyltransferase
MNEERGIAYDPADYAKTGGGGGFRGRPGGGDRDRRGGDRDRGRRD